jgi:hypothetical protein
MGKIKTRVHSKLVKASKAFRRKAFLRSAHKVNRSKNVFRIHKYYRRPKT